MRLPGVQPRSSNNVKYTNTRAYMTGMNQPGAERDAVEMSPSVKFFMKASWLQPARAATASTTE